ncbi:MULTISPECIES: acyltransferase [unclassified Bradyrhizobium]|uniref:acyltransferase family protein n=1 Tax=unclassified Bradyrhizobium TaxID=2631580 RepID=UPI002915DACF|nr:MULTISPECIES: acyltransferase [unclassified Bradyrhizobium]
MPLLDHLRFLAAGLVILFHTVLETRGTGRPAETFHIALIDQGHVGVGLFMVISGFIMMTMFMGRDVEPLKFYYNRALRIYPLLILIVSFGYFTTPDPRPTAAGINFLMSLLPISNLYRLQYGSFGGHLWTIAVELQFYLLLPILLRFRRRYGRLAFYGGVLGIAFALRAAQYALTGTAHALSYFSLFGSIDLFIGGMIAAEIYQHLQQRKVEYEPWLVLATLAAIGVVIAMMFSVPSFFHVDWQHVSIDSVSRSNKWVIWPLLQAMMWSVFLLLYLRSRSQIWGSAILANLGKCSYSAYIWHILVIALLKTKLMWLSSYALGLFLVLPVTLLIALVSYHLIELPFLHLRSTYQQRPEEADADRYGATEQVKVAAGR